MTVMKAPMVVSGERSGDALGGTQEWNRRGRWREWDEEDEERGGREGYEGGDKGKRGFTGSLPGGRWLHVGKNCWGVWGAGAQWSCGITTRGAGRP